VIQPQSSLQDVLNCKVFTLIVINDKSQGSIAKHLRCDELLYYTFITQSAGERSFKIDQHLVKLQAKWLILSCPHSPCTFVLKDADLAR